MIHLRYLGPEIWFEYPRQDWVTELERLLGTRYLAIESRLLDSFRFVDLHEDNGGAFSAGYASILRDACSAYSSTCDRLVRATKFLNPEPPETNNGHYRDFLLKNVPTIADVCVRLEYSYGDKYLIPFDAFRRQGSSSGWGAYLNREVPTRAPRWGSSLGLDLTVNRVGPTGPEPAKQAKMKAFSQQVLAKDCEFAQ